MGSEQSTAGGGKASLDPLYSLSRPDGADGVMSPMAERQESLCSDVELPYVSYTVNRPIGGDSPKKKKASSSAAATGGTTSSSGGARKRTSFLGGRLAQSSRNTMVTVNQESTVAASSDPELSRLADIPSFLPIMRASLSSGGGAGKADPDILERLDFRGLLSLCQRTENHLRLCAATVSTEQAEIGRRLRETDARVSAATQALADRQRSQARLVERLARVDEMSKSVARCHMLLNENIEQIEALNNMLPQEDRLEPFVWTTG